MIDKILEKFTSFKCRDSCVSTEICDSTRKIARDKQRYQPTVYGTATCTYDIYRAYSTRVSATHVLSRDRRGCIISLMARLQFSRRLRFLLRSLRVHRTFVTLMEMQIIGRRKGSHDGERRAASFTPLFNNNEFLIPVPPPAAFSSLSPSPSRACETELLPALINRF